MNVILLHSPTLVMKELRSALDSYSKVKLISLEVPLIISSEIAEKLFEKIKPYLPAIFFTINDGGTDFEGKFHHLINQSGSYLVNWYHDYPFYNSEFRGRILSPFSNRIDFISECSYVNILTKKGFNSYFLPLATDPSFFTQDSSIEFERDISFVGNSTLNLMDTLITEDISKSIEKNGHLFLDLQKRYIANPTYSIRDHLIERKDDWIDNINTTAEKFIFAFEWMIGYQYRRNFIVDLSKKYQKGLTVFGDQYWDQFVKDSEISPKASYYDTLSKYYQSSKINLNINRIQIHTSFTQRHFDTKACGAFLLTEKRDLNSKYFKTSGPDKEIEEFTSLQDCKDKIDYYLKNETERIQIAKNGMSRILKEHTYKNRLNEIFQTINTLWNI